MFNRLNVLKTNVVKLFDTLIWWAFLLLLISASFINELFSSEQWLMFASALYGLSGVFALNVLAGGVCNWRGLENAKFAIIVVTAILALLVLQLIINVPSQIESLFRIAGQAQLANLSITAPSWFEPVSTWSVVPGKTRWLLNSELLLAFIFCLSVALVSTRERLKQLLWVLILVCIVHSAVAVFAKYAGITLVDLAELDGHFTSARAWFINRNHFASFISLSLLGALAYQFKLVIGSADSEPMSLMRKQFVSIDIVYLMALLIAIVALVLSQSRATFVGFLLSTVIVLIVTRNSVFSSASAIKRFFVLPLVLIVIISLYYFGAELLQRFTSDSLLGERISQWRLTLSIIKESPLMGFGGNSYADVFQLARGYEDFRQVIYNQAHNDYLHIWLEQGLIGLCLWLSFIALAVREAFCAAKSTRSSLIFATMLALLIIIMTVMAQSMVDFNLQIINIRVYFFVIISLAFSVPMIKHRK